MKKKLIASLLCAVTLIMLISGCGNSANSSSSTSSSVDEVKEITFMAPDWANPGDELLAEFTEETGISVIFNEVGWDDIRDKVSIAASGQEAAADVIEVDWSWVGEMQSAGWLETLELNEEDRADMPTVETFAIDNEIYALPYANDYRIAYYNKAHFEEAGITTVPETWEEVYQALVTIKEAGVVEYPFTLPLNADESATTSLMWLAFSQSGSVFLEDGSLNKEAVLNALTFENQLIQEELIDPAAISFGGMDCYRKLTSGEASFMVGPTKFIGISNDPEQSSEIGNIVPILLPGSESASKQTMALPEAVGVTSFSENKEEAKQFVSWYTSSDIQKRMYGVNSSIPTRNSVLAEMVEDQTFQNVGAMLEQADLIKSVFPSGVPFYYSEMSNNFYNNINQMALGTTTPEEAVDSMSMKVDALSETK